MELTYENVVAWFDNYYKDFNKHAGPLETVPNMMKYFAPDLDWWSYGMPSADRKPTSRDGLLISMVHPGLHEELTPRQYIIDLKQMVVVVQFQLQFTDEISGTTWPPRDASCHYTIRLDENKDLKITQIKYWTEAGLPPTDGQPNIMDLWRQYRDKALTELATSWMKAPHQTLDEVKAKL